MIRRIYVLERSILPATDPTVRSAVRVARWPVQAYASRKECHVEATKRNCAATRWQYRCRPTSLKFVTITGTENPPRARASDLDVARREGHDSAIRYVLGYLNGRGDCGSTQYEEILNGCGREDIIRSAVVDGELEFTGLDRYVEQYGTAGERAVIRAKAEVTRG